MNSHNDTGEDGFICSGAGWQAMESECIPHDAEFDVGNPGKLEEQIRQLIDGVIAKKWTSGFIASRVRQLDMVLGAIAGPYPPPGSINLTEKLQCLAGNLLDLRKVELAELMAIRAMKLDALRDGTRPRCEASAELFARIWNAMGRHSEAAKALEFAVMLAQRRLRSESVVFILLYEWALSCMAAKEYGSAAIACTRALEMKGIDLIAWKRWYGDTFNKTRRILTKRKFLPLRQRVRTDIEIEYDRVAELRRQEEQKKAAEQRRQRRAEWRRERAEWNREREAWRRGQE